MERLPGVDAGFLYMETPTQHMHTLKIALLDVRAVPGGYSFERFEQQLSGRLHLLPPFRLRAVPVPLRWHHPVWVEDREFDQTRHVLRRRVPAPGGMRELERVIGEIASTPLDRSRPLWEATVCEGLADGRIAVVTKMHHSIADGLAANSLLGNVMDAFPDAPFPSPPGPWAGESVPPRVALLRDGVREWADELHRLPRLVRRTLRSAAAVVEHRRTADVRLPRPILDTPAVSFNGAISARRSFATATLPLGDVRRVKDAVGVTLNDVVLGVVAGALRRHLELRGELPAASLVAGVPVGTDAGSGRPRLIGNRVSNLFVSLGTDVDDPVERLRRIAAVAREAKEQQRLLGPDMLERWVQYAPPGLFSAFMRAYSRLRLASRHRAPFNVVVSNVPGPRRQLTVAGARLTDLFSVGPILEGIGLNVTVWSYEDRLHFSAITCPERLPDLPAVMEHLGEALAELVAATTRADQSQLIA